MIRATWFGRRNKNRVCVRKIKTGFCCQQDYVHVCRDDRGGFDPQLEDRSGGHLLHGVPVPPVCRLCHHATKHARLVVSLTQSHLLPS